MTTGYIDRLQHGEWCDELAVSVSMVQQFCHGVAKECGWWDDPATGLPKERNDGELIALMHSELSEALEALRKDLQDDHLPHRKGVECELADTIIRIMDYAGARDLDVAGALVEKLRYNSTRTDHKASARIEQNGKRF